MLLLFYPLAQLLAHDIRSGDEYEIIELSIFQFPLRQTAKHSEAFNHKY
jgi:hypothetical protein